MFRRYTPFVLLGIAVVLVIAWVFAPDKRFVLVACICFGYLLGWFSAWFRTYTYGRKQTRE
jgi:nucleoside permease NupC